MEQRPPRPITPFDNLVVPSYLQTLKLLIPYTPSSNQRFLAVYVKFLELQHTIQFFSHFKSDLHTQAFDKKISSPLDMISELRPFMSKQEGDMMESMMSAMSMMEMFQSFQQMNEESENSGEPGFGGFDPMDMMKGMLTPEQQGMFDMYNTMFSQETGQKGDDSCE